MSMLSYTRPVPASPAGDTDHDVQLPRKWPAISRTRSPVTSLAVEGTTELDLQDLIDLDTGHTPAEASGARLRTDIRPIASSACVHAPREPADVVSTAHKTSSPQDTPSARTPATRASAQVATPTATPVRDEASCCAAETDIVPRSVIARICASLPLEKPRRWWFAQHGISRQFAVGLVWIMAATSLAMGTALALKWTLPHQDPRPKAQTQPMPSPPLAVDGQTAAAAAAAATDAPVTLDAVVVNVPVHDAKVRRRRARAQTRRALRRARQAAARKHARAQRLQVKHRRQRQQHKRTVRRAKPTPATRSRTPSTGALPERPSRLDSVRALRAVSTRIRQCAPQSRGAVVPVRLWVQSSGRVQKARIGGPLARTPAAACIMRTLRQARFSPFRLSQARVDAPFLM